MQTLVDWPLGAIPELLLLTTGVAAAAFVVVAIRMRHRPLREAVAATLPGAALALAVGLILVLTLRPGPVFEGERTIINLIPFREQVIDWTRRSGPLAAAGEVIGNVAIFVPLGAAAAWRFGRLQARRAVIGVIAFSLAIETTQLLVGERRTADITDVLLNALGAMIGFELWRAGSRSSLRRERRARTRRSP